MRWLLALTLATTVACGGNKIRIVSTLAAPSYDIQGPVGAWSPSAARLPMGVWVQLDDVVAYTYVDAEAGPTARWEDAGTTHMRRLSFAPAGLRVLDDAAVQAAKLPAHPHWLPNYGPQPAAGSLWGEDWRDDPRFSGRFHPDYPDDLRVAIGTNTPDGYRFEMVWVSLRQCDDTHCIGALLNQPNAVPLQIGESIWFSYADLAVSSLPPASRVGTEPDEKLALKMQDPALVAQQQDDQAWVPDYDLAPSDRLVPINRWARVNDDVVWLYATDEGPAAWLPSGVSASLTWRPSGLEVLTAAEQRDLELPAWPFDDPEGPPSPAIWGLWRLDERLIPVLQDNDPDVLTVTLAGPGGTTLQKVQIIACEGSRCQAKSIPDGRMVVFSLDDIHDGRPNAVAL